MATSPSMDAGIDRRESVTAPAASDTAGNPRWLHVPESRFGTWFINTGAWNKYVLEIAVGEPIIFDRRVVSPPLFFYHTVVAKRV